GMSVDDLVARTGLLASEIGEHEGILRFQENWLASRVFIELKIEEIRGILKDFHRSHPLQPGIPKEELRSRELSGAPAFLLDAILARGRDVAMEAEIVRLASHRVALQRDEEAAMDKIEALFREGGLAVPATADALKRSGMEPVRARSLLQMLLKNRKLIRVGEDLIYHAAAIEHLRTLLAEHKGSRFSVTEFKEWTGVSRKYAIPLLEFLDRERVTRREGDSRVVLLGGC
ncbi:MAG: SelB C-terminal domain-containing protein, partial [Bryobacteraceae bacterium]